jgi:FtsP/CotA-like multicopper oxidase with cupredoxin domain
MTAAPELPSRRRLLAGTSALAGSALLPAVPAAQPASDGFRILRVRALGSGSGGGEAARLAFDGVLPGPTLRAKRGEELRVRLVNELAEPTTVHWHGVRLPNAMDGVAGLTQPAIAPGASFDYRFRAVDAGTFWYHAPSAHQIDRGLHGALIVEEAQQVGADREVVLVFGMPGGPDGASGPIRINGSARPDITVKSGERLRLRLINATAARGFSLKLDGHVAWVMAIDGQPAQPFPARDSRVGLAPGGRVDLFVDMTRDAGAVAELLMGARAEFPIARLVYEHGGGTRSMSRSEPPPLPPNPLPERIDLKNSHRGELALADAKPLDPAGPPLFTVKRGRAVTLGLRNASGGPRVVHLHGHHFRLLDRLDDGWKPYWMDTLVVGDQIERMAFVADNPGKWLIEWRTLERHDAEGATWFAVT